KQRSPPPGRGRDGAPSALPRGAPRGARPLGAAAPGPAAMADAWPNWAKVEELVSKQQFASGASEFNAIKKKVSKASPDEIASVSLQAPTVWAFLLGFAAAKKMYKNQIIQVINKLTQVPEWVAAWEASPELHEKIKELHEDLQAALGAQHDALKSSITPQAMQSVVRAEDTPAEVSKAAERERIVDEIKDSVLATSAASPGTAPEDAPFSHAAGAPAADGAPAEEAEEAEEKPQVPPELAALQDGIDAALVPGGGACELGRLRIGVIQCAGREEFFQRESGHAHEVFAFLLGCARDRPAEVHHVAEAMNQLAGSPSWCAVLEASPVLREALQELPVEAQAALGLQHEKVMALISDKAREKATGGDVSEEVKSVAVSMERIRSIRPAEKLPDPEPEPPKPAEEWKEARTPEGHSYYFNVRTKESTWVRPAALGGPHEYKVGEEVEVWSNSQRVWGPGKVESVEGGTITASFTMPGGSVAKKELPASHKDLRPVGTSGLSDEEKVAYKELFDAVEGGADAKGAKAVAALLRKSGLTDKQLAQLWTVGNPQNRSELNLREFSLCCRLVAHCQALGDAPVVVQAERDLRVKLRSECADKRPPALPRFES
ncbi:unnamed protein product, partial [Prorocentrum cordatum]